MTLDLQVGVPLRALNTFGVDVETMMMAQIDAIEDLPELFTAIDEIGLSWLPLGEGSNVLFVEDYDGIVVRANLKGTDWQGDHDGLARVRVGAAENWHRLVEWTLDNGMRGLENLALIPGSVGAAPVQNIGAYGVELDRFIAFVEAYDTRERRLVRLPAPECGFGYRESRFKREPERWLVAAVEFDLPRDAPTVTAYAGVREEIAAQGTDGTDPRAVFDAICALRRRKLPDPAQIGNAGSFFKNPVVPGLQYAQLRDAFPDLPAWPQDGGDQVKLSAAWLIEQAGMKGHRLGDAGISERHALVVVNHGRASGRELWALAQQVRNAVEARFGVRLEPEPRVIAAR